MQLKLSFLLVPAANEGFIIIQSIYLFTFLLFLANFAMMMPHFYPNNYFYLILLMTLIFVNVKQI